MSNVKSSSFSSTPKKVPETASWDTIRTPESVPPTRRKEAVSTPSSASVNSKAHSSEAVSTPSSASVNSKAHSSDNSKMDILLNDGISGGSSVVDVGLSEEQKEQLRFSQVGRKNDYVHMEMTNGRKVNVLQGLELHTRVFNAEEQKKIVECVYNLQRMGQKGMLKGN